MEKHNLLTGTEIEKTDQFEPIIKQTDIKDKLTDLGFDNQQNKIHL